MRKKIPIIISGVLIFLTLCFFTVFLISVNQAKNIVRLINEKNYEGLEDACETALFIDKIPTVSLIANALCEINVWTPLQTACINNDIEAVTILLKNGANPNILYLNKPHIGTDILRKIIVNMRKKPIHIC